MHTAPECSVFPACTNLAAKAARTLSLTPPKREPSEVLVVAERGDTIGDLGGTDREDICFTEACLVGICAAGLAACLSLPFDADAG